MKFTLRPYQKQASESAVYHLMNYEKPFMLVLPTGSGKSLIIADIVQKIKEPVLILQPTKEILEQNFQKLLSYGILDVSIYSASFGQKEISTFTYATIGSIYKNPELFKRFKYIILDECHLLNPKNFNGMYNQFFEAIQPKSVCGLTASPYRMVGKYFSQGDDKFYSQSLQMVNRIYPFFFKKIAFKIDNYTLFKQGYLSPIKYHISNHFDVSKIKTNTIGGDFDEAELERFWSDARLKKLAANIAWFDKKVNHNLIFCSSVRQARRGAEMLREMGMRPDYIHGKTPMNIRTEKIDAFREGKIKHMFNMGVLTVGFDFPSLDGITLARATMSLALYYQMVGRGLRKDPNNPKKLCRVLDIMDNVTRMGLIESIRIMKEKGGFKDIIMTNVGQISGVPLTKFKLKSEKALKKAENTTKA
jgi:DNA repair protein RadD